MGKQVTVLDIAQRVGLSKNTVSKILNGRYTGSDETRERVLNTVVEMKYKEYGELGRKEERPAPEQKPRNVVLLSKKSAQNFSIYTEVLNGIQKAFEKQNVNLLVSIVRYSEMKAFYIPPNITRESVDGIICLEVFRKDYFIELLKLGIPIVTIDGYYQPGEIDGMYDMILKDQEYQISRMTGKLLENHERVGFIGAYNRCRSFYERFRGYQNAMRDFGRPDNRMEEDSILELHGPHYYEVDWMKEKLQKKRELPGGFVCASDRLAVVLIKSLAELGYRVPQDVEVVSFDNSPEAELIVPNLTTAGTEKDEIGKCAAECLFDRMKEPDRTPRVLYLKTKPVIRDSARFRELDQKERRK